MKTPIYTTQQQGHSQSIELLRDKLMLRDRRRPLDPETFDLKKVKRINFVPQEPGDDPRKTSLSIDIEGEKNPKVVKSLDLEEARRLKEMIRDQQEHLSQGAIPETSDNDADQPFTYRDRVIKQVEKQASSVHQSMRNKLKKPNLGFRSKIGLFLILPLTLFGQVEITTTPAQESALLMNLPNVYLLPSSPLYPLKEFWGEIMLLLNATPEERATIISNRAKGQLAEVVEMVKRGDLQKASQTLEKYQQNIEKLQQYQSLLQDERLQWLTSQLQQHQEYRQLLNQFLAREGANLK